MNLVAYPIDERGPEELGRDPSRWRRRVAEAGAEHRRWALVDDQEPEYGLAVTGLGDPDAVLPTAERMPGDVIVLTKPLGAGAVATAIKRGLAGPGCSSSGRSRS